MHIMEAWYIIYSKTSPFYLMDTWEGTTSPSAMVGTHLFPHREKDR